MASNSSNFTKEKSMVCQECTGPRGHVDISEGVNGNFFSFPLFTVCSNGRKAFIYTHDHSFNANRSVI
jgi:hypothetical protein